jgi:hypothetical protein
MTPDLKVRPPKSAARSPRHFRQFLISAISAISAISVIYQRQYSPNIL